MTDNRPLPPVFDASIPIAPVLRGPCPNTTVGGHRNGLRLRSQSNRRAEPWIADGVTKSSRKAADEAPDGRVRRA